MGELINGRTPEEVRKGISSCFSDSCGTCRGCPYLNEGMDCDWMLKRDALALIEHLEAQQPKWIGVKERLPENCVSVLVWAVYHNEDGWNWTMPEIDSYYDMVGWDNTADPEAREVTHWMPLPKSPEANDA